MPAEIERLTRQIEHNVLKEKDFTEALGYAGIVLQLENELEALDGVLDTNLKELNDHKRKHIEASESLEKLRKLHSSVFAIQVCF